MYEDLLGTGYNTNHVLQIRKLLPAAHCVFSILRTERSKCKNLVPKRNQPRKDPVDVHAPHGNPSSAHVGQVQGLGLTLRHEQYFKTHLKWQNDASLKEHTNGSCLATDGKNPSLSFMAPDNAA